MLVGQGFEEVAPAAAFFGVGLIEASADAADAFEELMVGSVYSMTSMMLI